MATFYPTGGTTYTLGASIGSTDTSILLSSFYEPVSNTPYTMAIIGSSIVYATIAPQSTQSEFISFTGITQNANGTATLTGVIRGLGRSYPYSASSTFQLPHAGQSILILSDAPEVFAKYPAKDNAETVPGDWTFTGNTTFTNFPVTPSNSDASTTVKGVTKLSVAPAVAANPIAVGTNDGRIPVAYAVDSVGTDAYAITPSPAITAYAAGQEFTFKAGTANTGAATLNVNGLGAKTIKKSVTTDLSTGDILANQIVEVVYDGTNMQMTSTLPTPTSFSTINISTIFETDARFSTTGSPVFGTSGAAMITGGIQAVSIPYPNALTNFNEFSGSPTATWTLAIGAIVNNASTTWMTIGPVISVVGASITKHVGFKLINNNAATSATLVATQADGTTETVSSNIYTNLIAGDVLDLVAQMTSSGVNYYVRRNGTAATPITLTTNTPTGTGGGIVAVSTYVSAGSSIAVYASSMSYSR